MSGDGTVVPNPWATLRSLTDARIALGRAGVSLPTGAHLAFQLAHAQARDAVHLALDAPALLNALDGLGCGSVQLHSAAADRHQYLQRPDLGRQLDVASRAALQARVPPGDGPLWDLAIVVADGLSALAVGRHALPLLQALVPGLQADGWSLAPLVLVQQGRVAVADEVGEALRARAVLILIGERPGLSSPDSLGLYMTWAPRRGRSDAERNCISNVRPGGLAPAEAALRQRWLLNEARRRELSGVALKDETAAPSPLAAGGPAAGNFLLGGAG